MLKKTEKEGFEFKHAYRELEGIVNDFETREIDLDHDLPKFERGMELARKLQERLKAIDNEVKTINKKFNHEDV